MSRNSTNSEVSQEPSVQRSDLGERVEIQLIEDAPGCRQLLAVTLRTLMKSSTKERNT